MKRESSVSQSNSNKRTKKSSEQSNTLFSYFQPLVPNSAKTKVNSIINYFKSSSTESTKLKEEKVEHVDLNICKKEDIPVTEDDDDDDIKKELMNKPDTKAAWGAIFANKKHEEVKNEPKIKEPIVEETQLEDKQQKTYRKCPFYKFITGNNEMEISFIGIIHFSKIRHPNNS